MSYVDRAFIATNVELGDEINKFNPPTALQRGEFLEIITRMGQNKYKDSGICATYSEAVQKLLDEHVLKMAEKDEWQEFRDKKLWTLEVNDVFEANLDLLMRVYDKSLAPTKRFMSKQWARDFMTKMSGLNMNEKDAVFCYGMSKMTIEKENFSDTKESPYEVMKRVEFLEMIGRCAEVKFKNSQSMMEIPLAQRVEIVLDIVLPTMLETERRDVNIVEQEISESDDDY